MTESPASTRDPSPSSDTPSARRRQPSPLARLTRFPATGAVLILTVLVFAAQALSQLLLGFDLLLALGAKSNEAIASGQLWRYLTPILLHVGLLHLSVNMYSLYVIGPAVEGPFGSNRLLVIYTISGVAGVAASLAFSPHPSAGASGAIFGLLGAFGGFLYLHRRLFGTAAVGQLRHIAFVAIANLAIGLSPGIDNWGHLGGLLTGVGLSLLLGPRFERTLLSPPQPTVIDRMRGPRVWRRAALAGLAVATLTLLALLSPFSR